MKNNLKSLAVSMRKKGYSYNEILRSVPVSKSTLSLWLRTIPLTGIQKLHLASKNSEAIQHWHLECKERRIHKTKKIIEDAVREMSLLSLPDSFLLPIGAVLYWAEGAKEKTYRPSQGIIFSNSDPLMVNMFVLWLKKSLFIDDARIVFELYLHESHEKRVHEVVRHWAQITGYNEQKFGRIYFKKHKPSTRRKNNTSDYYGLVRVKVKRSTDLNRKIIGWVRGVCERWGVV